MQKYIRLPLLFFILASALGVFLRWQFVEPTPGINYSFVLHTHSHIMFLGWIFNALYLAFILIHIPHSEQKFFKSLFLLLQAFVVGMMISFPIQGYGFYSILFSTLHTITVIVFIVVFYKRTKGLHNPSIWYARTSLLFFLISTAGPFSLGYLMSTGLGQSQWYYFAIYYYLHFQYNGFFLFGILSLFFHLLGRKQDQHLFNKGKAIGRWMAFSCVPAYLLSVLWAKPGLEFNLIAGVAACAQLYALWLFISLIRQYSVRQSVHQSSYPFLVIVFIAFVLKLFLQLLSAHPDVAQFAYESRPLVIAYLHLVLIGVISLFALIWYMEMSFMDRSFGTKVLIIFLSSFCITQLFLIAQPWWGHFAPYLSLTFAQLIFIFSLPLPLCGLLFYWAALIKKTDKDHTLA